VPQCPVRGLEDVPGQDGPLTVVVFEECQPQGERVQASVIGRLRPDLAGHHTVRGGATGLAVPDDRHVERVRRAGRELGRVDVQPVPGRAQSLRPVGCRAGRLPARRLVPGGHPQVVPLGDPADQVGDQARPQLGRLDDRRILLAGDPDPQLTRTGRPDGSGLSRGRVIQPEHTPSVGVFGPWLS
jgi:hypothetical protein